MKRVMLESPGPSSEKSPAHRGRGKSTLRSFQHAWEGLVFAFSTQKHMRVHSLVISLVIAAAVGLDVPTVPFLFLLSAVALVLVTELFNTAVEHAVDLAVEHFDPRAKVAKDVAAGAVLVASAYSVVVGVLVFVNHSALPDVFSGLGLPRHISVGPLQLVAVGLILVGLIVASAKHVAQRGRFTLGGPVSGHAALGFLLATAITFITGNVSVAFLALAMALLIAQSRVQSRIHSPWEVVLGGLVGVGVGFLLFAGGR
jgi:diacylglycerol kinase (ATP)